MLHVQGKTDMPSRRVMDYFIANIARYGFMSTGFSTKIKNYISNGVVTLLEVSTLLDKCDCILKRSPGGKK